MENEPNPRSSIRFPAFSAVAMAAKKTFTASSASGKGSSFFTETHLIKSDFVTLATFHRPGYTRLI
jgi:hypothetical protein